MPSHTKTSWYFQTADWSLPLVSGRCQHETRKGTRCKNRVSFGYPLCSVHNKLKYGVQIKPSTIPGAGKGLFATRTVPKGSWLCPYVGEQTTMSCIHKRYPGTMTAPYTMQLPGGIAVDSALVRGIGSLANGKFNADKTVSSLGRHNCVARVRPVGDGIPGPWLKTTKTIKGGREIFLWYGEKYALQHNHSTSRTSQNYVASNTLPNSEESTTN